MMRVVSRWNRRKKCLTGQYVCVRAQDPRLSEPSDFSSEPSDYFSTSQPTTSEGGQSVLFFNLREIIATFTRATLCQRGTSQECLCLSQVGLLLTFMYCIVYFTSRCSQVDRRIELVFGTKASFDISYTVLYKKFRNPQNCTSFQNFVLNSGL